LAGSESFNTLAFKLDVDVNVRCCCRGTKAARFPAGANAEAERAATKRVATTERENFMVLIGVYYYNGVKGKQREGSDSCNAATTEEFIVPRTPPDFEKRDPSRRNSDVCLISNKVACASSESQKQTACVSFVVRLPYS
jgi:hypothetical protein